MTGPRTLYDKIWDAHAVAEDDGETLLYIDLHLLHEVTSPQAFAALEEAARAAVWPALTSVQRRRMAALGFAPAGVASRRSEGRRVRLSEELPGRRMTALRQSARLKATQKTC